MVVNITGLVDEQFAGFKIPSGVKSLVIAVTGMTRMTSFGVRQWLKAMEGLPKSISNLYLLGCPTFFVDQLNMVLNFGGNAQVLTVMAPYTCLSCGAESGEIIDVLAERATLAKGGGTEKECSRCGGKLEFDETPESYFSFVPKYAASSIDTTVAQVLVAHKIYTAIDTSAEKPPRIIKLVHGAVTYFRIRGRIGSTFRARPFLVGAEGEVVIDLAEVDDFDPSGQREWRRLVKTLAAQVPAVTLVDVSMSLLTNAGDSVALARSIAVWSVLVPYTCVGCGRVSNDSFSLEGIAWPLHFPPRICSTCGAEQRAHVPPELLTPLQKASTSVPAASSKLIKQRAEILSRALTDANVAQAGDSASASLATDDTILGKYKIVQRLSSGGMAEVFLAKQVGIGGFEKPVALKRIQRQLLENRHLAIDMFLNEAKIAGRLTHPNIVQVLDVGEVNGALYLAMEYVHGKDVREFAKYYRETNSMMQLAPACYIVREVAQALHHAYWTTDMQGQRLSVVHRDVSPHNIIIAYDGSVKLLDFGVAMSAVTEQAESMVVGKWQYMSPEHTTNQLDHRSDLFSLGVVMYLMLTGRMPFAGTDPKEIIRRIRSGQFKPVEQLVPQIPPQIARLVDRLLAPDPAQRPQTGQEVVAVLNEFSRTAGIELSASIASALISQLFPVDWIETTVTELNQAEVQRLSGSLPQQDPLAAGSSPRKSTTSTLSAAPQPMPPMSSQPIPMPPMPMAPTSLRSGINPIYFGIAVFVVGLIALIALLR